MLTRPSECMDLWLWSRRALQTGRGRVLTLLDEGEARAAIAMGTPATDDLPKSPRPRAVFAASAPLAVVWCRPLSFRAIPTLNRLTPN